MPNWNYNSVTIHATREAVIERLVPTKNDSFEFNMHKLFPEKVPDTDPTGDTTWEYDWYVEHTGSKWAPEVHVSSSDDATATYLSYDSARTPNNGTLQRLHELTGRAIDNEYDESGMLLEGSFTCRMGVCADNERPYRSSCEICELKKPDSEYDEEADDLICNDCRAKAKLLS